MYLSMQKVKAIASFWEERYYLFFSSSVKADKTMKLCNLREGQMENIARRTINDAELDLLVISMEVITEDVSADEIAWRENIM